MTIFQGDPVVFFHPVLVILAIRLSICQVEWAKPIVSLSGRMLRFDFIASSLLWQENKVINKITTVV